MAEETLKGIFYSHEEKEIGSKVDDLINFSAIKTESKLLNMGLSILELRDGAMFAGLLGYLDNTYADKLPTAFKPVAREVGLAIKDMDKDRFIKNASVLANMLVDIPALTESTEAAIISGLLMGILEAMLLVFDKEEAA